MYPIACMGCGISKKGRHLVCTSCATDLELIPSKERCAFCFRETPLDVCLECQEKGDPFLDRRAYCIEMEGPWTSFIYTAPLATQAALLTYQYLTLPWPWPGVIYSTESFFGREVAHFLQRPFRKRGPFYGEIVLVVERQEKDRNTLNWLSDKGALAIHTLSLHSLPER